MARCCAPVLGYSTCYRADDTTDTHCHRSGKVMIEGKSFCYQHAPVWREHYRIVSRIRVIRRGGLESTAVQLEARPHATT
jgi:hypothetical protein